MQKPNNIPIVIALGGSIVVPKNIQVDYLRRFHHFLTAQMDSGRRFVLVIGGGGTCRRYQNAASAIASISDEDKDWLGIHTTRLNAHLLRTIFAEYAYPTVLDDPDKVISKRDMGRHRLFIGSGWRPGNSTDYIAFRLAERFGSDTVLIATKIRYVYDKDVDKYKDAQPLKDVSWSEYIKIAGRKWSPGMKVPVDPIAAQFAREQGMNCVLLRGTNLKNLERYLQTESFEGSFIHP